MEALRRYQEKRKFDETPEPKPDVKHSEGPLIFTVQKHQASRLHYDFRLEINGVLKSWAVPKGPSMDPQQRRLAVHVEDHPLDYAAFEGAIPEGNYGAGEVIVWDRGTYCSAYYSDRTESERILAGDIERGHLSFVLNGEKLKGEFSLVRLHRDKGQDWLLIKKEDKYAQGKEPLEETSVQTGRTLQEVKTSSAHIWTNPQADLEIPGNAAKRPMPRNIEPMLTTPVDTVFNKHGWFFEIKWDGYRAIAEIEQGKVRLYSRNLRSFSNQFPEIVSALNGTAPNMILDGEIVVLDQSGKSDFQRLQSYNKDDGGQLVYYVFDILYYGGFDLRSAALYERKRLLKKVLPSTPFIRYSDHIEENGEKFYNVAKEQGLEGIIGKDAQSQYIQGRRTRNWLKIKIHQRQEAVVVGYTEPKGSREHFGSLVLGVYEDGGLVYIGSSGGGFSEAALKDIKGRLTRLETDLPPLKDTPQADSKIHWVKPELVAEIKFSEWTNEGYMRQPVFLGLREDKQPEEVKRERVEQVSRIIA